MVDERVEVPGVNESGRAADAQHQPGGGSRVSPESPRRRGRTAPRDRRCPARACVTIEPNWAELVVRFLTNPLVSPLLLSLGVLGLVFEIKTGAFGLGGLISLASLGLFFGSSFLVGLAGWEEVILLGVGLLALAVEVFILPGFGAAGLLGARGGGRGGRARDGRWLALDGGRDPGARSCSAPVWPLRVAVAYAWIRHLPNSGRFAGLFLRRRRRTRRTATSPRPPRARPRRAGRCRGDRSSSGGHGADRARAGRCRHRRRVRPAGHAGAGGAERRIPARRARAPVGRASPSSEDTAVDDSMLSLGVVLALVFIAIIILVMFFQFIPFGLWLTALFSGHPGVVLHPLRHALPAGRSPGDRHPADQRAQGRHPARRERPRGPLPGGRQRAARGQRADLGGQGGHRADLQAGHRHRPRRPRRVRGGPGERQPEGHHHAEGGGDGQGRHPAAGPGAGDGPGQHQPAGRRRG